MNPAETECLGCLYMNPLERLLGHDAGSDTYLSDNTAYVSFGYAVHVWWMISINACSLRSFPGSSMSRRSPTCSSSHRSVRNARSGCMRRWGSGCSTA
jgi:hypothetical protein